MFFGLPWARAVRPKVKRGKPFASPRQRGLVRSRAFTCEAAAGKRTVPLSPGGCKGVEGVSPVCDGSSRSAPSRYPGPGLPFYPGIPALSWVPPCRSALCPGIPPLSRVSSVGIPSLSRGTLMPRYPLHAGVSLWARALVSMYNNSRLSSNSRLAQMSACPGQALPCPGSRD